MKIYTKILALIGFGFLNQLIIPCTFVNQNPTNPCVLLATGARGCFLLFCKDSTLLTDHWNREIPRPCGQITNYKIYNNFQLILGVPENRVEYHAILDQKSPPVVFSMIPLETNTNTADCPQDLINFPPEQVTQEIDGFVGHTGVQTAQGEKLLDSLEVGDSVAAYDLENKTFKESLVININKTVVKAQMVNVQIDGNWTSCGPNQMFYLANDKKWVSAKDLKKKDHIYKRSADNSLGIAVVDRLSLPEPREEKLVSITLEKYHNFCTSDQLIVHNCMYTVVAGTVVPLVWDFACAAVSSKVIRSEVSIPSSLYPPTFKEVMREKVQSQNQSAFRQKSLSQNNGSSAYSGPNVSVVDADQARRNAQRVFDKREYKYYRQNAERLTLAAQLVWQGYRRMFDQMRAKVAQVGVERKNKILAQTEQLFNKLVEQAKERAKEKAVFPHSQVSGNSPDPEEECLEDDPLDGNQANIKNAFKELYDLNRKAIVNLHLLEKLSIDCAIQRLKKAGKQLAVEALEQCIKTAAELAIKSQIMPPLTINALGTLTLKGQELLAGAQRTGKFYLFLRGPSEIYQATKDIPSWNIVKGDYFYSDISQTHDGDHLEVFHKDGAKDSQGNDLGRTAKDVRNFDGTRHADKKKQALGYKKKGNEWIYDKEYLRHINKQLNEEYTKK